MLHTFKNTDNGKKPYVSNVNQNHWIPIAHISKNLWEFSHKQAVCFILPGNLYAQTISLSLVVCLFIKKLSELLAEFLHDDLHKKFIL